MLAPARGGVAGGCGVFAAPDAVSVRPYRTCEPSNTPCDFTTRVNLCLAVPVSFGATAPVTGARQKCNALSATACVPTVGP